MNDELLGRRHRMLMSATPPNAGQRKCKTIATYRPLGAAKQVSYEIRRKKASMNLTLDIRHLSAVASRAKVECLSHLGTPRT